MMCTSHIYLHMHITIINFLNQSFAIALALCTHILCLYTHANILIFTIKCSYTTFTRVLFM